MNSGGRSFAVNGRPTTMPTACKRRSRSAVFCHRIIRDNVGSTKTAWPARSSALTRLSRNVGMDILLTVSERNDEMHMDNVCVLTVALAERLFPYQDSLGKGGLGRLIIA